MFFLIIYTFLSSIKKKLKSFINYIDITL